MDLGGHAQKPLLSCLPDRHGVGAYPWGCCSNPLLSHEKSGGAHPFLPRVPGLSSTRTNAFPVSGPGKEGGPGGMSGQGCFESLQISPWPTSLPSWSWVFTQSPGEAGPEARGALERANRTGRRACGGSSSSRMRALPATQTAHWSCPTGLNPHQPPPFQEKPLCVYHMANSSAAG